MVDVPDGSAIDMISDCFLSYSRIVGSCDVAHLYLAGSGWTHSDIVSYI